MRMDKYLRRLEQIEGEVTALTSLAGDMNEEKRSRKKQQRNSEQHEEEEKNAEKSNGNVEAREARDAPGEREQPETGRRKMKPPENALRSKSRYVTTVKPAKREEPDSPTVGMLPWVD